MNVYLDRMVDKEQTRREKLVKELYTMKPLECICPDNNSNIMRVPGGWVFTNMQGSVFVPFDNEFMEEK